jgi:hypothetical protein
VASRLEFKSFARYPSANIYSPIIFAEQLFEIGLGAKVMDLQDKFVGPELISLGMAALPRVFCQFSEVEIKGTRQCIVRCGMGTFRVALYTMRTRKAEMPFGRAESGKTGGSISPYQRQFDCTIGNPLLTGGNSHSKKNLIWSRLEGDDSPPKGRLYVA